MMIVYAFPKKKNTRLCDGKVAGKFSLACACAFGCSITAVGGGDESIRVRARRTRTDYYVLE